ncbi:hypothetical protein PRIPAC_84228, partial [Pristionchus pacificus]
IFSIVRVCMHHKQGMGTEGERHGAGAAEPPPAYDQSANAPQQPYGYTAPPPQQVHLPGQPQPYGYTQPQAPLQVMAPQPYGYAQPQQAVQVMPGQTPYATYQPTMGAAPIIMQPGAPQPQVRWVAVPAAIPGCLPGLEFLAGLDKIIIRQKQDLIEIVTPIEIPNRYAIETPTGEQIYFAAEDGDFVQAQVMGADRGYRIKVYDGYNRFGGMRTRRACCASSLTITDENDKDVITIDGPCCCTRCCSDADFPLKSASTGTVLGQIKRKYLGYIQANYSKADVFEIDFPSDLSVRMKAAIIGACIMIDFLEFEVNTNRNNTRHNSS